MRPRMKYSNSKISPAKFSSTTGKALVPPCKLRGSQQKTKEVCHVYCMRLRSGLTIRKETGYFEKKPTKRYSLKSGSKHEESFSAYPKASRKRSLLGVRRFQAFAASVDTLGSIQETSPLTQSCASLSTYDDQSVSFVLENGCYVINVEDSGKDQEKDKVLLRYYKSSFPASQSGDGVDGKKLMVNMSPVKDTDIWLHANDKDHSVELQRCDVSQPDQAFFVLHKKASDFVSFECKNLPGTYIGVKDNQLALVEEKDENGNSIMFKLSKM
ncbi:interleukin-33 [Grammomys surdaster]|uniref:interleukin-33 n=1 Tax=Grammomys surdaster TaxID=491861 RepID=UPI00109F31F4|nr:interleukin-33 [Grammomys surdaster]XP_028619931.1 interleukin-33 [Grammomys surdaster]XP_028619932.1 interleukin-33 [Grammomys surdaster]XP_028619933.1 interleukin-33 [Grammomys surdaster]